MRVISLASGSSGNATLVESGETALLIDAGLNARVLARRLCEAGCDAARIAGIVLTHEHSDHTTGALNLAWQYNIPIMADARTLAALMTTVVAGDDLAGVTRESHPVGSNWRVGNLSVTSFPIPHDAVAPCGYLIATDAWRICLVTDCGAMNDTILAQLRRAQLIILEANHDRDRLVRGPYPQHLKRRILSPQGHLANHEAAEAIHYCLVDDSPRWVWLAHLSRTNNTPVLARTAVEKRLGDRRLRTTRLAVIPPAGGPMWDSQAIFVER